MKICVVGGAGYVGLMTGLGLSEMGRSVVNVDVDQARVRMLKVGESPIHEEGVVEALQRNLAAQRLPFSTDTRDCISASEFIFIAVGTHAMPHPGGDSRGGRSSGLGA